MKEILFYSQVPQSDKTKILLVPVVFTVLGMGVVLFAPNCQRSLHDFTSFFFNIDCDHDVW